MHYAPEILERWRGFPGQGITKSDLADFRLLGDWRPACADVNAIKHREIRLIRTVEDSDKTSKLHIQRSFFPDLPDQPLFQSFGAFDLPARQGPKLLSSLLPDKKHCPVDIFDPSHR